LHSHWCLLQQQGQLHQRKVAAQQMVVQVQQQLLAPAAP
jgi:hypothetical protein